MNNVPEIRFKGFEGAWEQRKLGEHSLLITKGTTPVNKSGAGDINFVKVENISEGKIYPVQKITNDEHENYLKRSKLCEHDILFSIAGTLGRTALVDKSILPANTNQALAIIRGYDFDTNFLLTALVGRVVGEFIKRNPTIGAQPNLSLEQVGSLTIWAPSFPEQAAIGNFFRTLDETLTLCKRKLDGLKELKRGYLQQMFPQTGESVPRVRFAGFEGAWEQKQISDLFTERSERSSEGELISVTISSGVVKASSLERKDNSSKDKSNYKRVEVGDIAYNSMRMWQGASGVSDYSGILSPAYTVIIPMAGACSVFFSYMFKLERMIQVFQSSSQGLTSDTWNLKFPLLKNIIVTVPCYEEQTAIGTFFLNLDEQITAWQNKWDKLKQLKAAYLQRMFV